MQATELVEGVDVHENDKMEMKKYQLCVHFITLVPDAFKGLFRSKSKDNVSTLPMIHVYGFSKARDPEFDFHEVSF